MLKFFIACGGQAGNACARMRARPPASLRQCLAPALRASLNAYNPNAYKSKLTVVISGVSRLCAALSVDGTPSAWLVGSACIMVYHDKHVPVWGAESPGVATGICRAASFIIAPLTLTTFPPL